MENKINNKPDLDEDKPGFTAELQDILAEAGRKAIAKSFAKGIPVTYRENGVLIREYPDGKKEVVTWDMVM